MSDVEIPRIYDRFLFAELFEVFDEILLVFGSERKAFEFFDTETNTMRIKPGSYEILYGNSSRDEDLKRLTLDYQQ